MENTLYIVDDHSIVRFGLKEWLETNSSWKVVNSFSNSRDCLNQLKLLGKKSQLLPEIIIIDIQLAGETGFALCKEITGNYKNIKCVIYSMYNTSGYVLQAIESGASGYISKISSEKNLLRCLETVKRGQTYLENEMKNVQIQLVDLIDGFTNQEKTIFEAVLQGKTNEQIGEELFISTKTVNNYVCRIYRKADVQNREELLRKYGQ